MVINNKIIFSVFCVVFSLLIFSSGQNAQEIKNDSLLYRMGNTKPELNGHKFITSSLMEGPFVNTFFRLNAGIGTSSNYDVPLVIRGVEVQGLFGEITFATFNVKYQQKIKDWLAFSVSANITGRLGSQTVSVITEGINLGSSFNFGWLFKAHESRKFMLSASLLISNNSFTAFNMYEFVEKIIQDSGISKDNKLVKTTNVTAGLTGIKAAYAFNRTFGCIGKLNFGYGESISGVNKGYFDAGLSIDADLNPKYSVPIGFALGYDWNNFSQAEVSIKNPQSIMFKINYTGRKDFDLGVEMNAQFLTLTRLSQDFNLEVFFIKAGIAYYF